MTQPSPHQMHLRIAEQGKLLALKSDHNEALRHYREAMRLAVSLKAPEVFIRHYTQCVLESLEQTQSYDELIRFCLDADAGYSKIDKRVAVHHRDHASLVERLGLVQLKKGELEEGKVNLMRARKIAGTHPMPLSEEILGWLGRGFTLDARRITESQHRHKYFVVRADQVDRKRATPMKADRTVSGLPNTKPPNLLSLRG